PIETRTTSPSPCFSLTCSADSMPDSSPGSSTTSRSRVIVLSASSADWALGSGTCLTVTRIFTQSPFDWIRISLSRSSESLKKVAVVGGRVEVGEGEAAGAGGLELGLVEVADVQLGQGVGRPPALGLERGADRAGSRLAVGGAGGLRTAVQPGHGGVVAAAGS